MVNYPYRPNKGTFFAPIELKVNYKLVGDHYVCTLLFCLDVVILCIHVFTLSTDKFIHILHYLYTKFNIGPHSGSQTFNFTEGGLGLGINLFFSEGSV